MSSGEQFPDYAIGPLLLRAQRHAAETFNTALTPLGIEGRHFGILMTLDRLGPMSQVRLAERLGADKSAMVRLIDHLETHGLVERNQHPTDRRMASVTVTAAGTTAFKTAQRIAAKAADHMLSDFDDHERAQFKHLLAKFVGITPGPVAPLPGRRLHP